MAQKTETPANGATVDMGAVLAQLAEMQARLAQAEERANAAEAKAQALGDPSAKRAWRGSLDIAKAVKEFLKPEGDKSRAYQLATIVVRDLYARGKADGFLDMDGQDKKAKESHDIALRNNPKARPPFSWGETMARWTKLGYAPVEFRPVYGTPRALLASIDRQVAHESKASAIPGSIAERLKDPSVDEPLGASAMADALADMDETDGAE